MIGDDACSTFVELLKRILDIVSDIEKEKRRGEGYQKKNTPKIKVGKLSKANFAKLQKAGADFKFVTVPANKLAEIEETVKKMGGSYFNAEVGDNNNAVLAVPASQLDLLNMAMKHVVANELAENSENIIVKDGKGLNPCINQNCKRRLIGDAESGYSWEYYCDSDHDNLTGEIGACLTADELLAKVMELTDSENMGVDEDACKELIESYLDMFKKELNIDEDDFRKFGAADNEKAQEFYQLLITDELPNADLWEVDTPFSDDEE